MDIYLGGINMNSCWLIEHKSGSKVILTEKENEQYQDKLRNHIKNGEVLVVSHWFNVDICKMRNKYCIIQ